MDEDLFSRKSIKIQISRQTFIFAKKKFNTQN